MQQSNPQSIPFPCETLASSTRTQVKEPRNAHACVTVVKREMQVQALAYSSRDVHFRLSDLRTRGGSSIETSGSEEL